MDAFPDAITTGARRARALRMIALLGVVWAALVCSSTSIEATEQGNASQVAPAGVVLAPPSAVFRAPIGSDESLAPPAVVQSGPTAVLAPDPALSRARAERPDPLPGLFSRVSYRTTGPPHLNG